AGVYGDVGGDRALVTHDDDDLVTLRQRGYRVADSRHHARAFAAETLLPLISAGYLPECRHHIKEVQVRGPHLDLDLATAGCNPAFLPVAQPIQSALGGCLELKRVAASQDLRRGWGAEPVRCG